MRKVWILCLTVCMFLRVAEAVEAVPRPTLERQLESATHVFIGVAKKVTVIGKDGEEVKPEPQVLKLEQSVRLDVETQEVLSPSGWTKEYTIPVRYGWGLFEVSSIKSQFLNKPFIYITEIRFDGKHSPYWESTYAYYLIERVENKVEVQKRIKPRSKKEVERWAQLEWLAKCMSDVDAITAGMTRREVESLPFVSEPDPDITNWAKRRYIHRECPFLYVSIEFSQKDEKSTSGERDTVVKVSKASLERLPQGHR